MIVIHPEESTRGGRRRQVMASVPLLLAALAPAAVSAAATTGDGLTVPTDGMVFTESAVLAPGTYQLPVGLVIGADDVTLDLNGAILVGSGGFTAGITAMDVDGVTITGGSARGYYYGVRVERAAGVSVLSMDLSENWRDPEALEAPAPFLDINVGPELPDFTNLGGGLYLSEVTDATISGNTMRFGENGVDAYGCSGLLIEGNDCSDNVGWGIHLNGSTGCTLLGNACNRCTRPGLGDSAGVLLVNGSSGNIISSNEFRDSGDGFFIGNENGCPSNDNLVIGNDGSNAGANAFEATFSSGNQFVGNVANGSAYGFWLGYSHSGNVIQGNQIRANTVSGIEIEHGQNNEIRDNVIVGNGGSGIVLRTDGTSPFPPDRFPCLDLPDQSASSGYTVTGNVIQQNFGVGVRLESTTLTFVADNVLAANAGGDAVSDGAGVTWSYPPSPGENVLGGTTLGGNWWTGYTGMDLDDDGLGDTETPFTDGGAIADPGDLHPLVGKVDLEPIDNPSSLCARRWVDVGPNTRLDGTTFETSNGTHFATDGASLWLLEGTNGTNLSRFEPAIARYAPLAPIPEAVWDGGGAQWAAGRIHATVGIAFDVTTGDGKGPRLYAYDPVADTWSQRAPCVLGGAAHAIEALAHDQVSGLLYATVVAVQEGGPADASSRLAIYDPERDAWIGATAPGPFSAAAGSEAEWIDGRVYVWRGGFNGGLVNGADSFLDVYDPATDSWSMTPALQDFGVVPGFRSGAFDVWGVTLTADHANGRLFVQGGEANSLVMMHEVDGATWTVAPTAVYDGGWGDGLEFVAARGWLVQIDGRNAAGGVQGTAVLQSGDGDLDGDREIDGADLGRLLAAWGPCVGTCCPEDLDEDGEVDGADLGTLLAGWSLR